MGRRPCSAHPPWRPGGDLNDGNNSVPIWGGEVVRGCRDQCVIRSQTDPGVSVGVSFEVHPRSTPPIFGDLGVPHTLRGQRYDPNPAPPILSTPISAARARSIVHYHQPHSSASVPRMSQNPARDAVVFSPHSIMSVVLGKFHSGFWSVCHESSSTIWSGGFQTSQSPASQTAVE